MKEISINSIDLILTSPPYMVGKEYDETIDLTTFINMASKKITDNGVFVWQVGNRIKRGFIEPIDILYHHVFLNNGFKLVNRVIWHFGHGLHCRNRLSGRYETVCIYARNKEHTFNLDAVRIPQKYPNKKHYKGPNKGKLSGNPLGKNPSNVWDITNIKSSHPEKTNHPCQFPLELCKRIIKAFSNSSDIVMDPFMGSGSTGVACKKLNRKFIGIEKEEKYFDIAKKRINGII